MLVHGGPRCIIVATWDANLTCPSTAFLFADLLELGFLMRE